MKSMSASCRIGATIKVARGVDQEGASPVVAQ